MPYTTSSLLAAYLGNRGVRSEQYSAQLSTYTSKGVFRATLERRTLIGCCSFPSLQYLDGVVEEHGTVSGRSSRPAQKPML